MGSKVEEKIIKPPLKRVSSGKIFKPSKAFLQKRLFQATVAAIIIWLIIMFGFMVGSFLGSVVEPESVPNVLQHINVWIALEGFWAMSLI